MYTILAALQGVYMSNRLKMANIHAVIGLLVQNNCNKMRRSTLLNVASSHERNHLLFQIHYKWSILAPFIPLLHAVTKNLLIVFLPIKPF